VDSKAQCDELNLKHVRNQKKYKEEETKTKQTPVPT